MAKIQTQYDILKESLSELKKLNEKQGELRKPSESLSDIKKLSQKVSELKNPSQEVRLLYPQESKFMTRAKLAFMGVVSSAVVFYLTSEITKAVTTWLLTGN